MLELSFQLTNILVRPTIFQIMSFIWNWLEAQALDRFSNQKGSKWTELVILIPILAVSYFGVSDVFFSNIKRMLFSMAYIFTE